jgi:hypothetical protein
MISYRKPTQSLEDAKRRAWTNTSTNIDLHVCKRIGQATQGTTHLFDSEFGVPISKQCKCGAMRCTTPCHKAESFWHKIPLSSSCKVNGKDGARVDRRLKPPVSHLLLMQASSHLILQMAHAHPPLNSGAASPSSNGLLEGLGPFPSPEAKLLRFVWLALAVPICSKRFEKHCFPPSERMW